MAKGQFSVLDEGVVIEGTMSCKGLLVINGTVKGKLSGEEISIGPNGAAHAEIEASKVKIGGKFEGKLKASEEFFILSTGICQGEFVCKNIVIQPGGILNGTVTSTLQREQPLGKLNPKPSKS